MKKEEKKWRSHVLAVFAGENIKYGGKTSKTILTMHTCQPIQFTSIKYFFFNHYFRRIWPYWKMDTRKHNFCEFCCFKLAKRLKKLSNEQLTHAIAKCTL